MVFQRHIDRLIGMIDRLESRIDFSDYLNNFMWLSAKDMACCEKPIIIAEIQDAIASWTRCKRSALDGLSFELHTYVSELFGNY